METRESESIEIIRESAAAAQRPALLWSEGKDSAVLLHLVRKAFYPQTPPFILVYLDRGQREPSLIEYRSRQIAGAGMGWLSLPLDLRGSSEWGLFDPRYWFSSLVQQGIDLVLCALRREEGRQAAVEQIFSPLGPDQTRPSALPPPPWGLYNTHRHPGEILLSFPLAHWTEPEIWIYLYVEGIPIAPLYLAAERQVRHQADHWLLVAPDQDLGAAEPTERRWVRVPTLSIWPPIAIESRAETLEMLIGELLIGPAGQRGGYS